MEANLKFANEMSYNIHKTNLATSGSFGNHFITCAADLYHGHQNKSCDGGYREKNKMINFGYNTRSEFFVFLDSDFTKFFS